MVEIKPQNSGNFGSRKRERFLGKTSKHLQSKISYNTVKKNTTLENFEIKPQNSKNFGTRNQENLRFSGPGNPKISKESLDFHGEEKKEEET